ncbi:hypothetical protein H4R34_003008 [Dimargaris verticillata]|uniref:Uricase n=1 Tax=Dimargaris verticillata TaxID=2761393 RepID=A0A9W8E9F7_9FUNG|nr:hypothetical protein H4R34_003008 [Dimargaris verticillata]
MADVELKSQRYGKDRIRVVKVVKSDGQWQEVAELSVRVLLEGDFETSYTQGDNSKVVATDSIKNTVYVLAKRAPSVVPIESFALTLGQHFLHTYAHVDGVHVDISQQAWRRMRIDNQKHPHSFLRDTQAQRVTTATTKRHASGVHAHISSGFRDLAVLKTTGSAFYGFLRDQYTTLRETNDRILCTNIDCRWEFPAGDVATLCSLPFDQIYTHVEQLTLGIFARENSASVQATLYNMATRALRDLPALGQVSYALPNNHIFSVDLAPLGLQNMGKDADVYMPIADPSGLITAVVGRKKAKL